MDMTDYFERHFKIGDVAITEVVRNLNAMQRDIIAEGRIILPYCEEIKSIYCVANYYDPMEPSGLKYSRTKMGRQNCFAIQKSFGLDLTIDCIKCHQNCIQNCFYAEKENRTIKRRLK